ncbi:MAG: FkbM family methyltransferase [Deltaproteobacteria bacterium]|nr:FkbM family methyltransferase [Deltaproteobacteria bacterium]
MLKTKHKIAMVQVAQSAVMRGRRALGKTAVTRARRLGVNWELDLSEGIDFAIWLTAAFELETVRAYKRMIRSGDVVLDIGANIGAHTLHLAQAAGASGRVIAFEPTDWAFAKLLRNCALNPELERRIECNQVMLVADEAKDVPPPQIYSSWPLSEGDNLHQLHGGQLKTTHGARARTLDGFLRERKVDRVDFVKLDIDGFECSMLRGAKETLSRSRPRMIMELAPYALAEQGASIHELIALLREYGYRLSKLSGQPLTLDAALFDRTIPAGASMNVIAI